MAEQLVPRDEARAALAARRELGDEFDDALVESFARRIEERLKPTRTPARRTTDERGMSLALAIVSVGCGIPITAIAISGAGLAGLIVAWAGIVLLNVLFARLR
jgi:anti-sigma factor RsiW